MEAGGPLDALVAEKVMGWHQHVDAAYSTPAFSWHSVVNGIDQYENWVNRPDQFPDLKPWSPSTDIAAAWEVVERLRAVRQIGGVPCDLCIKVGRTSDPEGDAFCDVFDLSPMGYVGYEGTLIGASAWAATAPLAICLAALKAVEAPAEVSQR